MILKFTLLENAFDYILDAVNKLEHKNPDKKAIKYAIVHLWSGIELLLKKRLMDEHWSLIFRDVNKANKSAMKSGDFVSVYFDELIERLNNICGVDVSKFNPILTKLRVDRNRLEHFHIEISKRAAISNLFKAWGFILDFTSSHTYFDEEPEAKKLFEEIRSEIVKHKGFIEEWMREIEPEINENQKQEYPYTVMECPECLNEAMFLLGGFCECKFCRIKLSWEEAMDKWLALYEYSSFRVPKEELIGKPLVLECPECGMEALYQFENFDIRPPDPGWICFHCGHKWAWNEIKTCERCDRPFLVSTADEPFCGKCWPKD